jgi:hypothetical protein
MAKRMPLLSDELNEAQRVSLASLKQHPGFSILEQMFMAACKRATEEVIKLDPIEEGYERKLKALQSVARERNQFCLLVLESIDWQVASVVKEEQDTKPEPNPILVKGIKNDSTNT